MKSGKEVRILTLLVIDTTFFFIELISGYAVHSLALIADSFHMLNDIISLVIALWAVNVAKNKDPDAKYTYGWKRAEILGALINSVFLVALCVSILIEAIQRFFEPQEITNPKLVLVVGCFGLLSNFVGLVLFHSDGGHGHGHSHGGLDDVEHGHGGSDDDSDEHSHSHGHGHSHLHMNNGFDQESSDYEPDNIEDMLPHSVVERTLSPKTHHLDSSYDDDNESTALLNEQHLNANLSKGDNKRKKSKKQRSMNMHGVFLHVLGDALGNIGVISTALFIWKTNYSWRFYTDPAVSLFISIIIFSSAIPLSMKASRILLQATPSNISADDVKMDILALPGVISIHDFHIWNLTESLYIASLHVEVKSKPEEFMHIAKVIRSIFHKYGIHSATVQPEFVGPDAVTDDIARRFSRIAGGGVYGSTTNLTGCTVDETAQCNTETCLE
ncbi:zinc/cadmium resistance protein [Kluyveromyces marxianus]|uniref:Zinc/cadmium resistance protein n=2 Tax=Kluyveromyces marxianus TaxID=4911 RepID=W0T573_KLUMD|nr:zinc/cadmium resistance protein [Kluyveromyces marxianus DMKU3-1042]QGN14511.1 zinc/cadmium resistance protein [Kluyveromyces marxianus]BAO38772.1 zinc/cadmium resistance protein [Kluyveromyces marxianus DMKU3-1042]